VPVKSCCRAPAFMLLGRMYQRLLDLVCSGGRRQRQLARKVKMFNEGITLHEKKTALDIIGSGVQKGGYIRGYVLQPATIIVENSRLKIWFSTPAGGANKSNNCAADFSRRVQYFRRVQYRERWNASRKSSVYPLRQLLIIGARAAGQRSRGTGSGGPLQMTTVNYS